MSSSSNKKLETSPPSLLKNKSGRKTNGDSAEQWQAKRAARSKSEAAVKVVTRQLGLRCAAVTLR